MLSLARLLALFFSQTIIQIQTLTNLYEGVTPTKVVRASKHHEDEFNDDDNDDDDDVHHDVDDCYDYYHFHFYTYTVIVIVNVNTTNSRVAVRRMLWRESERVCLK